MLLILLIAILLILLVAIYLIGILLILQIAVSLILLIAILLILLVAEFTDCFFADFTDCYLAHFADCYFADFTDCYFADFADCYFADFQNVGHCIAILLMLGGGQAHYKLCTAVAHSHQQNSNVWSQADNMILLIAILLIWLGQPMAFSMQPFDIDRWKKNGDDAELESVLGLLANLSEQDPKKMAEEVRSMSGSVRRRMRHCPGIGLLEAWEAEADGRFKGRAEATSEGLYTIRAIYRGTGSLESRFHKGRCLNGKKHMNEDSMEARLRIYVDGPPLEKFCTRKVVRGRSEYAGSSLCKRSQAQYRRKYGAKALRKSAKKKAEDEASIPVRSDKGKRRTERPGRMAKFLKQKKEQVKEKKQNAISDVDKLVMKKLKESKEGPSDAQLKANKTSAKKMDKKRKFIDDMMKPGSQAVKEKNEFEVEKHEEEAKKRKYYVASLRGNALQERHLVAEECKMFVAPAEDRAEDACKSLTVERCYKRFLRRDPDKKKLWFSQHAGLLNDFDWQQGLVEQKVLSKDMAFLGAVVFGGYLVDEKWEKASKAPGVLEKKLLVEPVWKLVGSMKKAFELTLDESLANHIAEERMTEGITDGSVGKVCKLLMEAKPDKVLVQEVRSRDDPAKIIQESSQSCWTWHGERSGIKRKESWVVCSDQARVETLTKKKEKMSEEFKKLEEKIAEKKQEMESAEGEALLKKRRQVTCGQAKLKAKRAVLNKMKGEAITLEKFLEQVVLPQCRLMP